MRIALFCATQRGYRFLQKLHELAPDAELVVFSFEEDPWEPPFLDDIRQFTGSIGGQFFQGKQAGASRWTALWQTTPVDLMLAVGWRYMIPAQVYEQARLGAYVLHDSLLPAYRGFSPTVWAIINGEDHTGVTLLEMVDDYDAGDIIGQQRVPIGPDDTIDRVVAHVTDTYLSLLAGHWLDLINGRVKRTAQDHTSATYTAKLHPDDFQIDWHWPSARIYNLIRATTRPYAGAYTSLDGQKLSIWSAARVTAPRRYVGVIPGRVVEVRPDVGTIVLTGDGVLLVRQIQLAGAAVIAADTVLKRLSQTLGR